MILNFALFVLFSLQFAAAAPDFYFLKAVEEISASLNDPAELNTKLDLMNIDSRYFEISKSILDDKTISEYVQVQEQLAKILLQALSPDFKDPKWFEFASHLITSLQQEPARFKPQALGEVFGFLFATGNPYNSSEIRSLLEDLTPTMITIPKMKIYGYLIKYVSTDSVFIIPPILSVKFLAARRVEAFINEYIQKLFVKIAEDEITEYRHFDIIVMHLLAISFTIDLKVSDSIYELLLKGFKRTITEFRAPILNELLDCLKRVLLKVQHNLALVEIIMDIMFDEHVVMLLESDKANKYFLNLIISAAKIHKDYYETVMSNSKASVVVHLSEYSKYIKMFSVGLVCQHNLNMLSLDSNDGQFRLALSSAKNLRKIHRSCPAAIDLIPGLFETQQNLLLRLKNIFFNISHEHNCKLLQIVAHMSLLDFDMSDENDRYGVAGNMSHSIGSLINRSHSNGYDPKEFIEDVLPNLDYIIPNLLIVVKNVKRPMSVLDLSAHLSFVRLHSSPDVVLSATNELCFAFIISMPIRDKGYAYLKDLDFIDEYSVVRAGFFHFIEKYSKNPSKDDHPHLGNYFKHLLRKGFVSKTEMMALAQYFESYGIKY